MHAVLDSQSSTPVLCCYKNYTQRIQVVKVANVQKQNIEKVIFPSETFLFEVQDQK